jgi:surfactin synthase thioesterase subunit
MKNIVVTWSELSCAEIAMTAVWFPGQRDRNQETPTRTFFSLHPEHKFNQQNL